MVNKYELPPLPYAYDALEPHISKEIMNLHHDKHHLAYVNGANAALEKLENGRKNSFDGMDVKAIERDLSFHYAGHSLHSIPPNLISCNYKDVVTARVRVFELTNLC